MAEYVGEREINADLMAEFLQKVHLKFKPRETEVQGALDYTRIALQDRSIFTKDNVIRLSMMFVGKLQAAILARHWSLEVARRPRLITSDSPLILWRKPSSRDQFTGLGLDNAEEIRFPVSPAMQLVFSTEGREPVRRIEPDRVRACNADVALACYNAVIGHPRRTQRLQRLNLPAQPPALRFNIGPGYQRRPDGTYEEIGDILHMWTPRR